MSKTNADKVALAIAKVSRIAGHAHDADYNDAHSRAMRLRRLGYIVDGDPQEWGNGAAVATIYCEQLGGPDDCEPPMSYYRNYGVSFDATSLLRADGLLLEWVNAAVLCAFASPDITNLVTEP